MAFPSITGSNGGGTIVNATTSTINLPASIAAGDLLLAIVTVDQNAASAFTGWPTGWTQLYAADGVTSVRVECRYKIADGAEGASFALGHVNNMSSHHTLKIAAGTFDPATPPEAAVFASTGTSTAPDAPNLAPSWGSEDTLWLWVLGYDDGSTSPGALGGGFTLVGSVQRGNNGQGTGTVVGSQDVVSAALNPANNVTTLTAAEVYVAATIAIRSATSGTVVYQSLGAFAGNAMHFEIGTSTATGRCMTLRGTNAGASIVGVRCQDASGVWLWVFDSGAADEVVDGSAAGYPSLANPDDPAFASFIYRP